MVIRPKILQKFSLYIGIRIVLIFFKIRSNDDYYDLNKIYYIEC